ncbi:DUF5709 domain-containing protein [Microbacterium sp. NPDC058345]|uniref:DUF5709 domain-containing protein n=1 Tax=Microbacterium sp. NPDC058345 TaxID=3346455 RepID=UPI003646B454
MSGNDDAIEYTAADELGLLPVEESLDSDEFDEGALEDEGYSPLEYRSGNLSWGLTEREARGHEPLAKRLARELPDITDDDPGDGLGDAWDTDGELLDDQVGSVRAGRLVLADTSSLDPQADYWARDVGIDGAAASAEEAAIHVVVDDGR